MGAGFHGKFNNTKGAKEAANTRQSLPQNNAQLKHIFSGKDGHLTDTPQNRQLLSDLANDTSKLAGKDSMETHGISKPQKKDFKIGFAIKTEQLMKVVVISFPVSGITQPVSIITL